MIKKAAQMGTYIEEVFGFKGIYVPQGEVVYPQGYVVDSENVSFDQDGTIRTVCINEIYDLTEYDFSPNILGEPYKIVRGYKGASDDRYVLCIYDAGNIPYILTFTGALKNDILYVPETAMVPSFSQSSDDMTTIYMIDRFAGYFKIYGTISQIDGYYDEGAKSLAGAHIFPYKNRMWGYGLIKNPDGTVIGNGLRCSAITSFPENEDGSPATYTGADFWDEVYTDETADPPIDTVQGLAMKLSVRDNSFVTGAVPYGQQVYIFTPTSVSNLVGLTEETYQINTLYEGDLGAWSGDLVPYGGIYYISKDGIYIFTTNPNKVSKPIEPYIDLSGIMVYNDGVSTASMNQLKGYKNKIYFNNKETLFVFNLLTNSWEKYKISQMHSIFSYDALYIGGNDSKIYTLDTGTTVLPWYVKSKVHSFYEIDTEKRPVELLISYKSTEVKSVKVEVSYEGGAFETLGTFNTIVGENHQSFYIYKYPIRTMQIKISGTGNFTLLGYKIYYRRYIRHGR